MEALPQSQSVLGQATIRTVENSTREAGEIVAAQKAKEEKPPGFKRPAAVKQKRKKLVK
jgi:hypothetical protein